ncbi:transposase [Streptomyces sparsogenes]|uniref:transposase n=1 Tax=Streptomyces sparsogenes TaxID=67365 RepID=UPI000978E7AF|nr:transposase [Streptomyces sparsogenes]
MPITVRSRWSPPWASAPPSPSDSTRSAPVPRRGTEFQQKIRTQVRKDQKSSNWQRCYAIRAGCEATVSETVHAHGLRHCRYRGLAKTHVQHVLTAAGANIIRLLEITNSIQKMSQSR